MEIDKFIVLIFSFFGIGFTYWYFLMKKDEEVIVQNDSIDIEVNGGYNPSNITISNNKTTKINFIRRDSSSCLEEVIISDFKIKKYLPLNKLVSVELTPDKKGEYVFSCGMNMFHGKLKVV